MLSQNTLWSKESQLDVSQITMIRNALRPHFSLFPRFGRTMTCCAAQVQVAPGKAFRDVERVADFTSQARSVCLCVCLHLFMFMLVYMCTFVCVCLWSQSKTYSGCASQARYLAPCWLSATVESPRLPTILWQRWCWPSVKLAIDLWPMKWGMTWQIWLLRIICQHTHTLLTE